MRALPGGSVAILGVPVDNVTMQQALSEIEAMIREGAFHQIATANLDFLINSIHDEELKEILSDCRLVLPDGMPLVWASRIMGASLQERVTGSELVPKLVELSDEKGYRIFLLGARESSSRAAANWIERTYPRATLAGRFCPPWAELDDMDHEAMLLRIEAARPDILLVAFGSPKQEKWLAMHRHRLRVPVCIGVGGSLDILSGLVPRAPKWMQNHGLEWLFRIYREPTRLGLRYARDASGLLRYLSVQLAANAAQGQRLSLNSITEETIGTTTVLHLSGVLTGAPVVSLDNEARLALEDGRHLVLDLADVCYLGPDALGSLIHVSNVAKRRYRELWLTGLKPPLLRMIQATQLQASFRTTAKVSDALRRITLDDHQLSVESGKGWGLVRVGGQLIPISREQAGLLCEQLLRFADLAPKSDGPGLSGREPIAESIAIHPLSDPVPAPAH
jgi:N-acetylglucosaminyldiphosphoundecaprenol N-acetyl-beta-D-mannosaminyltransferase